MDLTNCLIVVTGAAGFLGRMLTKRLREYCARILCIDQSPLPQTTDTLPAGDGGFVQYHSGDLNTPHVLDRAFDAGHISDTQNIALFHLSGLSHVEKCNSDPLSAYETNVLQLVKVLEACRRKGIFRIVFPSTALIYGENRSGVLTEQDAARPQNVYASTKLAAEAVIHGYAGSYGFSCDIARFSNIYGPDAHPDTAVSIAVRQAFQGGPISLKTHTPVRDFLFYKDAIEGIIRLFAAGNEPGSRVYHISSGIATSIGEMVQTVHRIANRETSLKQPIKPEKTVESRLILSNAKLKERTYWSPEFTLEAGLKATWKALKDNE